MKRENIIVLIIMIAFLGFILLNSLLARDMEEHIERVSKECAEKGYGIKAAYTKEGDKYYVCNEE